jgi:chorismate mutase
MALRAIRGATSVESNTGDAIAHATKELLLALLSENDVSVDEVVSVFFTATPDLNASFPATAARGIGFDDVPLICAVEIDVPNSLPRCVRIMMHVDTTLSRESIKHVYLRDAQNLRNDIKK